MRKQVDLFQSGANLQNGLLPMRLIYYCRHDIDTGYAHLLEDKTYTSSMKFSGVSHLKRKCPANADPTEYSHWP